MRSRPSCRAVLRAATFCVGGVVLLGADGCDVLYRLVQCVLTGDCGEVLGDLVDVATEPAPPPPPSSSATTPADVAAGAAFGDSMAAPATAGAMRLVVGAPTDATTGAVWAFPADDGAAPVRLSRSGAQAGDAFGSSVAIESFGATTLLVVGAPDAGTGGAAFVFEHDGTGWTERARLEPDAPELYARFGASVAIATDGDASERTVLVGSPGRSDGGRVFVFRRDAGGTWAPDSGASRVPSFQQAGTQSEDRFGACVASAGRYLVVGSPGRGGYTGAGAASLWRRDPASGAWTSSGAFLEPEGLPSQAGFGHAVAVTLALGDERPVALVGAVGGGYSESGGVVWSFARSANGSIVRRRFASGGVGFGRTVAADPRRAAVVVGSPSAPDDATWAARVYSPATLDGPDTNGFAVRGSEPYLSADEFGASAVIRRDDAGGTVVHVGAPGESLTGRLHRFDLRAFAGAKAAPKPEPNRYLAFRATAAAPGDGETRIAVEQPLRAPFRAELSLGSFSAARRAGLDGGSVSFRIDRSDGESPSWAAVRIDFGPAGISLRPEYESGPYSPELRMSGEWIADVAIDAGDESIRLLARPRGAGEFVELASFGAVASEWSPSVAVRGISAGSEIGMDEPRILTNAAAEGESTPSRTAVDRLRSALTDQMAASAALDERDLAGAEFAAAHAAQDLDIAKAALEAAAAAVTKRAPPRGPAAALRQVIVASRDLAKARAAIAKSKRNAQIVPRLSKSAQSVGRALAAMRT